MISFGFEDSFKDGFEEGFVEGTAFRGLSETIGRIETFFLVGTKAGTGTRGTETEARTGVALAVEIAGTIVGTVAGTRGTETEAGAAETFGTVGVVGTAGTEAKVTLAVGIVGIAGIAEIGAGTGIGVALGMEAFSCARLNKSSR
jgi:hypothetical protein